MNNVFLLILLVCSMWLFTGMQVEYYLYDRFYFDTFQNYYSRKGKINKSQERMIKIFDILLIFFMLGPVGLLISICEFVFDNIGKMFKGIRYGIRGMVDFLFLKFMRLSEKWFLKYSDEKEINE